MKTFLFILISLFFIEESAQAAAYQSTNTNISCIQKGKKHKKIKATKNKKDKKAKKGKKKAYISKEQKYKRGDACNLNNKPAKIHKTDSETVVKTMNGKASFYADKYNGRKTANGEIFSNKKMTAAHRTLAFGTRVRVTNPANGRSVIVRINDRGPFSKDKSRIIDLSKTAASSIGIVEAGVANVKVEILK